jgi:hypothetical protein
MRYRLYYNDKNNAWYITDAENGAILLKTRNKQLADETMKRINAN